MALSRLLEILIYLSFFAFFSFLVYQILPDFLAFGVKLIKQHGEI